MKFYEDQFVKKFELAQIWVGFGIGPKFGQSSLLLYWN